MIGGDRQERQPGHNIFSSVSLSVMTVNWVASEPLPAVVGNGDDGQCRAGWRVRAL